MFYKFSFIVLMSFSLISIATEQNSPAGLWKTYDDKGEPTGFVRITEQAGIYTGVIEKGLETDKEDKYCTECKDERKGQNLVGMTMMKGVKAKGDVFEGNEILDPFSGNTYRVKLTMKDAKKMEVRGFIGVSLFGRTQVWERAENGQ
ncbi:MAG: DUF2147 domain-containing protein [Methylophilaceae bacterium]